MKSIAFLFMVAALAVVPATANHSNAHLLKQNVRPLQWASTDADTGKSSVDIHCTVFSVNPLKHSWMTAAHCVQDPDTGMPYTEMYFIDGHPAMVVNIDVMDDLAVLDTPDWHINTSLGLATVAPHQGDIVENMGYSWGLPHPLYYAGYVSSTEFENFVFAGMTAIGGQSGSPVVNHYGDVVGVTHVRLGGGPLTDFSPLLGFTPYNVLKVFDMVNGVFAH